MKYPLLILCLFMTIGLTSCVVSKKKYDELSALKNKTQKMLNETKAQLREKEKENEKLTADLNDCNEAKANLEKEIEAMKAKRDALDGELTKLEAECSRMNDNYEKLKDQSTKKLKDMVSQLEALQSDLAAREARLAEVESALNRQDSLMQALRNRVADALLGFQKDGLTVEVRNGKVYVSLSNKLLFSSGSTKIDENGQLALKGLAEAIVDEKDLSILVEGHTDDVPVSNLGAIKDNWDLSVMRSTEVVRYLTEYGLETTRVIPSGRGEYIPKVAGKSPEARASNRRTEIIISPKLDELYELINQQPG